jgi:hypothetical protein
VLLCCPRCTSSILVLLLALSSVHLSSTLLCSTLNIISITHLNTSSSPFLSSSGFNNMKLILNQDLRFFPPSFLPSFLPTALSQSACRFPLYITIYNPQCFPSDTPPTIINYSLRTDDPRSSPRSVDGPIM